MMVLLKEERRLFAMTPRLEWVTNLAAPTVTLMNDGGANITTTETAITTGLMAVRTSPWITAEPLLTTEAPLTTEASEVEATVRGFNAAIVFGLATICLLLFVVALPLLTYYYYWRHRGSPLQALGVLESAWERNSTFSCQDGGSSPEEVETIEKPPAATYIIGGFTRPPPQQSGNGTRNSLPIVEELAVHESHDRLPLTGAELCPAGSQENLSLDEEQSPNKDLKKLGGPVIEGNSIFSSPEHSYSTGRSTGVTEVVEPSTGDPECTHADTIETRATKSESLKEVTELPQTSESLNVTASTILECDSELSSSGGGINHYLSDKLENSSTAHRINTDATDVEDHNGSNGQPTDARSSSCSKMRAKEGEGHEESLSTEIENARGSHPDTEDQCDYSVAYSHCVFLNSLGTPVLSDDARKSYPRLDSGQPSPVPYQEREFEDLPDVFCQSSTPSGQVRRSLVPRPKPTNPFSNCSYHTGECSGRSLSCTEVNEDGLARQSGRRFDRFLHSVITRHQSCDVGYVTSPPTSTRKSSPTEGRLSRPASCPDVSDCEEACGLMHPVPDIISHTCPAVMPTRPLPRGRSTSSVPNAQHVHEILDIPSVDDIRHEEIDRNTPTVNGAPTETSALRTTTDFKARERLISRHRPRMPGYSRIWNDLVGLEIKDGFPKRPQGSDCKLSTFGDWVVIHSPQLARRPVDFGIDAVQLTHPSWCDQNNSGFC